MIPDSIAQFIAVALITVINTFPDAPVSSFPALPQFIADFGSRFYTSFLGAIGVLLIWRFLSSFFQLNNG